MKRFFLTLGLVSAVLLSGCGESTIPTTTTTTTSSTTSSTAYASYFPMRQRYHVTYTVRTLEGEAVFEDWLYRYALFVGTVEVFQIDVVTGEANVTPYYYWEDSTGVYSHGSGSPEAVGTMIFKYPPSVGVSWESGTIWGKNQIVTEETIATAIGSIICRKVSYAAAPGSWHFRWFAQNIGMVRESRGYSGITTTLTTREIYNKNF